MLGAKDDRLIDSYDVTSLQGISFVVRISDDNFRRGRTVEWINEAIKLLLSQGRIEIASEVALTRDFFSRREANSFVFVSFWKGSPCREGGEARQSWSLTRWSFVERARLMLARTRGGVSVAEIPRKHNEACEADERG